MQRVLVVGAGGAGKSTFARTLGQRTGLPVVHLDQAYWRSGWVAPAQADWHATVDALVGADRWILDGNFGETLERRLVACDTVVFLDMPRLACLWRVVLRRLRHRGRARADMTPGCHERLSPEFAWWIWTYGKRRRPKLLARLQRMRADQRVVILRSDAEAERFLDAVR